jgi:hypothetical protein
MAVLGYGIGKGRGGEEKKKKNKEGKRGGWRGLQATKQTKGTTERRGDALLDECGCGVRVRVRVRVRARARVLVCGMTTAAVHGSQGSIYGQGTTTKRAPSVDPYTWLWASRGRRWLFSKDGDRQTQQPWAPVGRAES